MVSSFSVNLPMFIALRVCMGLIISGMIGAGYCLFVELLDLSQRFVMSSVFGWAPMFIAYGCVAYMAGW